MGFYVTLLYIAFQVLSPAVLFPQLTVYRVQFIVAGLAAVLALIQAPLSGYPMRAIQNVLVTAFFGWAIVAWLLHGWLGGAMMVVSNLGPVIIVYYLLTAGLRTLTHFRMVATVLVVLSLYAGLRGFLAFHYGIDSEIYLMEQHAVLGEGPLLRARFLGVFSDPNDLAQMHLTVLPMLLMLWKPQSPVRNFVLVMPILAFLSYCVYLTHSRGVLVGLAFLIMVYLRSRFNPVIMTIGTVAFAVGMIAMGFSGGRSVSFGAGSDRIEAWGVGLGLLKSYPLHGVGFMAFTEYHEITAHNSFVLCFSELGIVGFFLWMGIIVCSMKQLNSILALQSDNPRLQPLLRWARMVQLAFTGFLVTSWFLSRTYSALFWILVAMSTAITDLVRRELAGDGGTVNLPAVARPDLRQRINAILQGMPPPRWLGTTAALQSVCLVLIYLMVRLRWFG